MKYHPSSKELLELGTCSANERMHYFLTRTTESEEIWGLGNSSGWIMKDENMQAILPVWPYEVLARDCAVNEWQYHVAEAVSLEQFVYKVLPKMIAQDIKVELLPTSTQAGIVLDAAELATLFEGMMESGEYYMEG